MESNFLLNSEDVIHRPLERLAPHRLIRATFMKLGIDPKARSSFADRTRQKIIRIQFISDSTQGLRAVLVPHHSTTLRNTELLDLTKDSADLLRQSIRKDLTIFCST